MLGMRKEEELNMEEKGERKYCVAFVQTTRGENHSDKRDLICWMRDLAPGSRT